MRSRANASLASRSRATSSSSTSSRTRRPTGSRSTSWREIAHPTKSTWRAPVADHDGGEYLHTWIGSSDAEHITIGGRDLASEVMGHFSLTQLAYLLITRREPT